MIWLLLVFLLIAVGVYIGYSLSPASEARKRTRAAVGKIETLGAELRVQDESIRSSISQTTTTYIQEIRTERLRSIQVDELKRHGSGIRLQALKDSGLRNLADLQGWNDYRLAQLRGVGPKSATAIAHIVNRLTSESNALPIPHPILPFSLDRERRLLQAIYRHWWFQSNLSVQRDKLQETIHQSQERQSRINKKTALARWIWGFGSNEGVKNGIAEAGALCTDIDENGPIVQLYGELSKSLQSCQAAWSGSIATEVIVKNYEANGPFYSRLLEQCLGRNAGPIAHPMTMYVSAMAPIGSTITPLPATPSHELTTPLSDTSVFRDESYRTPTANDARSIPPHISAVPNETLVTLRVGTNSQAPATDFTLPETPRPQTPKAVRWLRKGEAVSIQGFSITKGLLFCGQAAYGENQGVIDPTLPAKRVDESSVEVPAYCYGYTELTPDLRARYLEWLANGATDSVGQGFGLLYFFGLERRLLQHLDAGEKENTAEEQDEILHEVSRIVDLFQESKGQILYYGQRLVEFFSARSLHGASVLELPPIWERSYELPFRMLYGLGCFIRDKQPIPLEWALRWAYLEPTIYLRTPATRCKKEFEAAFAHVYEQRYGEGLVIPPNKTILKLKYQTAWHMFRASNNECVFAGIPDVRALSSPQQSLREIVEESTTMLDAYSRLLGRNPAKAGTLEAYLALPPVLWPENAKEEFGRLQSSLAGKLDPVSCQMLFEQLGCAEVATLGKVVDLARNLVQLSIGFEPDVLAGARRPKASDTVVLFPLSTKEGPDRTSSQYKKASLMVALYACVALADGHASESESEAVDKAISMWTHLHADLRTRLRAQYRLQVHQPASVASLRTKLTSLAPDERIQFALSMSSLANTDSCVSPEEVKLLEWIYRTLELEPQLLYSHLHVGSSKPESSISPFQSPERPNGHRVILDKERIGEVQRETNVVSEMLASVFVEEETDVPELSYQEEPDESVSTTGDGPHLPGLDPALYGFLKLLMQKPEWARMDLVNAASQMQIMLDGALERINEASLDFFGEPLIEGDDPIFVQQNVLESTEQWQ
jgi:uncharacterized tellurite resistance protein B-like protein